MPADSVSPLVALDVSAARSLLLQCAAEREAYANECSLTIDERPFRQSAKLLRQVSAALASLDSLLPALLADGAENVKLREAVAGAWEQMNVAQRCDWLARLKPATAALFSVFDEITGESWPAADAARAVRPAGAAPTPDSVLSPQTTTDERDES